MKEAMHYVKKAKKTVQCGLCPRNCVISEGSSGVCKARKNVDGVLYRMVFSRPIATHADPIEKKPLFHFYPGTQIFSIGTVGCNLMCQHCQNWQISRASPTIDAEKVIPEKIVELAIENDCDMIAYTYTEPTVFYEYVLETAKIANQHGLKNVIVSNGYINKKPLEELMPYLDGANIDLKGFTEEFYKDVCFATLKPVLETLKRLADSDVWLEVTNLIIPGQNDDPESIE
ncbi:AmmeMemoRadiSam system radical SAM enzyme, partial [Thermoproteota archaeon]